MNNVDLSKEIYNGALQCGFDDCGILPIQAFGGFQELFQKRINDVPQSKFFYDNVEALHDPAERFPWAKSIVLLTHNYGRYRYPKELQGKYAKAFFLWSDKKMDLDYDLQRFEQWFEEHEIHAEGGEKFQAASVGPLRYIAAKAGLGLIRKNNFFYTEKGSYVNLIGYAIDKECELIQSSNLTPCSEKCDLCQKACKTKALQSPYTLDPLKCVSFWTTFGNSDIPQGLNAEMFEEWVCGCDNCQDACPHNYRQDWNSGKEFSNLKDIASMLSPGNYEQLSDAFLMEQVIPKTAGHLQPSDIPALRKNAARALKYHQQKQKKE